MNSNNNKILYIGLNGLAGSGKDTVAKMLNIMLMKQWTDFNQCYTYYNNFYTVPNASASYYEKYKDENSQVICLAFADQLKHICASIFGIPAKCFYFNKSTAWICVNHGFEYTEIRPDNVVTCEDYYYNLAEYSESPKMYWMSLRDILVYVGTYILQQDLNRMVFVNTISNQIKNRLLENKNLKYAIITDVRFSHELDYIHQNNGITIQIIRDGIEQLSNIAEHDLDDEDSYNFTIINDGSVEDLFLKVWNLVHDNVEFQNQITEMNTRENINNYLRLVGLNQYKVCSPYGIQQISHSNDGEISMIDLRGGPTIYINQDVPGTNIHVNQIIMNENTGQFLIYS